MHAATTIYHPETPNAPHKAVVPLAISRWKPETLALEDISVAGLLESGQLLYLPDLPFQLTPEEKRYLQPDSVDAKGKSVKFAFEQDKVWGAAGDEVDTRVLKAMLRRYAESATALVTALFPRYVASMRIGNTSFRPVGVEGRKQSKRQDDSRLHVDAFPSRPVHGERLLRVFSNVHPGDMPRVWRVGEPFADVAARFLPGIGAPVPGSPALMKALRLTKRRRSAYDHYMLRLHDRMKFDDAYQKDAPQTRLELMPGSSWIVFTDQVSHAAMSGQHMMEQTFMLPVEALYDEQSSPLKVLEKIKGRRLV